MYQKKEQSTQIAGVCFVLIALFVLFFSGVQYGRFIGRAEGIESVYAEVIE